MLNTTSLGSNRYFPLLLAILVAGCSGNESPASQTTMPAAANPEVHYDTELTIAEIMDAIVMREADVLWQGVSFSSNADGFVAVGPESEEDWTELMYAAMALAESSNNLLIPGRHANRADAEVGQGELTPAEIDSLIASQRDTWAAFAGALRNSAEEAIAAIDARDADQILEVGGAIDEACEGCHVVFWYPNQ